jgi:hypothetical protein
LILTNSILEDVRLAMGLTKTTADFDTELLMHVNASIGKLNQNGIGKELVVTDKTTTWGDLQDPTQVKYENYFKMVPLFIMLSTKILFDPPPPSSVQHHQSSIEQLLWRLKIAYEEPYITTTTIPSGDWYGDPK